jgi:hypothetical protein
MKYSKPEITRLGESLTAIQMGQKESPKHDIAVPSQTTVSAYESDE